MGAAAPLFVALLDAWASLYTDLSLGAAVETNINHATSSDEQQVAGGTDLSLVLGLDKEHGRANFWIEAGYEFVYLPAYVDLTSHAGSLGLGASLQLTRTLSVRLQPSVSAQAYGDSARDGFGAGGSLGLRYRPAPWMHVSARFSSGVRSARDSVFAATTWRGGAFIGVTPVRLLDLSVGYALASTDIVQYTTLSVADAAPSRGGGRGRQVTTFDQTQVATREPALVHSVHANLIVLLPLGLYVLASYTGLSATFNSQSYVDHVLAARLGVTL